MTVEERRAFVSDLAAKLYAHGGCSGDEAATIAFHWLEVVESEWSGMTPEQRTRRFSEALAATVPV